MARLRPTLPRLSSCFYARAGWFGRAAAAYVDWLEGPEQPARDSMEKCLDPTAEEMELGYPGR